MSWLVRASLVAVFAALATFGAARAARAQACCASTSAIFPARLQGDEDALVGLGLKLAGVTGSFDGQRTWHGQPDGAHELDFAQTVLATVRPFPDFQINVAVPFEETYRSAGGLTDAGGGVSDMKLSMRWDVTTAGRDPIVPGIAGLLSLTVPSGKPIESASGALAADATGLGAMQLDAGLAFEQLFGHMLFATAFTASFHEARTASNVHSQLGPDLAGTLAATYVFRGGAALGASFLYTGSWDASVAGATVPGSARALTQLAAIGSLPLTAHVRLVGSLYFVPPISSVGQNEPASVGLSATLIYGFFPPGPPCVGGCKQGSCPPRK